MLEKILFLKVNPKTNENGNTEHHSTILLTEIMTTMEIFQSTVRFLRRYTGGLECFSFFFYFIAFLNNKESAIAICFKEWL